MMEIADCPIGLRSLVFGLKFQFLIFGFREP